MMKTRCPHCNAMFKAPDEHKGKMAKCPKCHNPFTLEPLDDVSAVKSCSNCVSVKKDSAMIAQCPHCRSKFKARDELSGVRAKCPNCSQPFTVEAFAVSPVEEIRNDVDENGGDGDGMGIHARRKKHYLVFTAVFLIILAVGFHVWFCEWHFDDSATGAYCIIPISQKRNPVLYGNPPKEKRESVERAIEHIMVDQGLESDAFDVVNGLFARNDLPAVGSPVDTSSDRNLGIPKNQYNGRHIGVAKGQDDYMTMLLAKIFGIGLPMLLLVISAFVSRWAIKLKSDATAPLPAH